MLRGQKALMGIASNDITIASTKHTKGCFTNDRDNALACRFWYHSNISGKRYDICLAALNKEFYLSETVIGQRLMKRQAFLKELKAKGTTARDLQTRYPHFNWR